MSLGYWGREAENLLCDKCVKFIFCSQRNCSIRRRGKNREQVLYGHILFNKTLGKAMCSRLRLGEIWQTWKYEFALQTCPVFGHTMNDPPRGLFLHGATRIGDCLWEWAKWTEKSNHQAIQTQIASTEEKGGNLQLWWVKSLTLVIKTKC